MRRERGTVRRAAVVMAAALLAAGGACRRSEPTGDGAKPASRGPAVEYADLDRLHAILQEKRGRPLLVNYWATWCVPCVDELPALAALSREGDIEGAAFLGVSLDGWVTGDGAETTERVERALRAAQVGYTNLVYRGDQDPLVQGMGLPGPIPYSVLYDPRGKPTATWQGPLPIPETRRAIARLLRSTADAAP